MQPSAILEEIEKLEELILFTLDKNQIEKYKNEITKLEKTAKRNNYKGI